MIECFYMQDKIQEQIKEAMRAKDQTKLNTLRGVISSFTNESVAKGRTPQDKLSEDEALAVVRRLVKQRKDSIEQFTKGGRSDLAENEEAEMKILEQFLPALMSEEEIKKIVEKKISEIGKDKQKIGVIVGSVMKECAGNADGNMVKKIVESLVG